jgi:hypothetical protein
VNLAIPHLVPGVRTRSRSIHGPNLPKNTPTDWRFSRWSRSPAECCWRSDSSSRSRSSRPLSIPPSIGGSWLPTLSSSSGRPASPSDWPAEPGSASSARSPSTTRESGFGTIVERIPSFAGTMWASRPPSPTSRERRASTGNDPRAGFSPGEAEVAVEVRLSPCRRRLGRRSLGAPANSTSTLKRFIVRCPATTAPPSSNERSSEAGGARRTAPHPGRGPLHQVSRGARALSRFRGGLTCSGALRVGAAGRGAPWSAQRRERVDRSSRGGSVTAEPRSRARWLPPRPSGCP